MLVMELLKTKCHEILEFESKFYKKNKSHTFYGFSEIKYSKQKYLSFEINRNFKLKKTNKKHQPFDLQDKKVSKEVQKGRNECSTQRLRMICCISKVCVGVEVCALPS